MLQRVLQQEPSLCSPIPLFVSPRSICNPSTPLAIRAWWMSSAEYVADLELPLPRVGGLLWLERCVPVAYCAGLLPPAVRTDHPGDVHFSQNLYHPSHYPTSVSCNGLHLTLISGGSKGAYLEQDRYGLWYAAPSEQNIPAGPAPAARCPSPCPW